MNGFKMSPQESQRKRDMANDVVQSFRRVIVANLMQSARMSNRIASQMIEILRAREEMKRTGKQVQVHQNPDPDDMMFCLQLAAAFIDEVIASELLKQHAAGTN